jgi:hypothetical protein
MCRGPTPRSGWRTTYPRGCVRSRCGIKWVALRAILALTFFVIGLSTSIAWAGDASLKWHTLSTPNFRIHYHGGLEQQAQRTASLAEQLEHHLIQWLGKPPSERTEIVLTDVSDSSNGFASVLPYSAITLYVTAPDDLSVLNDYDDWLPTLVSHEQTHIVHLNNVSGLPALVSSILGKQTAPNQLQPHWLLEGLAVYAESRLSGGGRLRSSQFDMYLRADVLENNFASIDQITHVPRRWPGATLWYLYGGKFVEFIAHTYGESVFATMMADTGDDVIPFAVNRPVHRATGRTFSELYSAFKAAAERRFHEQVLAVESRGRREGQRLTFHGRSTSAPRFVPERCWSSLGISAPAVIYFRDDGHDASGFALLTALNPGGANSADLVARSNGGSASFTSACDLLLQSSAPSRRQYYFNDLFMQQHGTRSPRGWESGRIRLTTGRRTRDPDLSHDGHNVVYVTDRAGTTTLRMADFIAGGKVANERALVASRRDEQVFTPRFSPDDRYVAYSAWTRGGYRDLRVFDRQSNTLNSFWKDRSIDQEPSWSPDGRWLYFSSDRGGISNIFALELATGRLSQVTNVVTGAFSPEVSPDGRRLVYVGYNSGGFDLYVIDIDRSAWLPPPPTPAARDDRVFLDDRGTVAPAAYNPLPTLRPRALLLDYTSDSSGTRFIATVNGGDIVGLHSLSASAVFDSNNSQPDLYGSYAYLGFKETIFAGISRTTDPNTQFQYGNSIQNVRRVRTSASTGVQIPLSGEFFSQSLFIGYAASHLNAQLPTGTAADPYAQVPVEPFRGFLSSVRLGYYFSNTEQYLYSVGAERGLSASLSLDRADRNIGSELEGSSAMARVFSYHPMPWAKHHVLALGTTLAASSGPAEGGYAVGGYQDSPLLTSILNGIPQSRLTLRGYPSGQFQGSRLLLMQTEYRLPVLWVDRGLSTLPAFLHGLSAAFGADYGGAFTDFDNQHPWRALRLGLAAELWTYLTFGYGIDVQLALGYARGTGAGAIPSGTSYLVLNSGL